MDPQALCLPTNDFAVQGLGVSQDSVNKDLLLYKSILSKMSAAKVRARMPPAGLFNSCSVPARASCWLLFMPLHCSTICP